VKKGTIQDATFVESDPGHGKQRRNDGTIPVDPEFPVKESDETDQPEEKQSAKELRAAGKPDRKEKKKAMEHERNSADTGRSKDGTWAVENRKPHFGYKYHTGY
jgi:hypothetical protein